MKLKKVPTAIVKKLEEFKKARAKEREQWRIIKILQDTDL